MKHENPKQFKIEAPDAIKILCRAREMVEKDGWCKKLASAIHDDGTHLRCTSQAMIDATREVGAWSDFFLGQAERLFIEAIGTLNNNIPDWNDNKRRKKADVLAAFDKAIMIGLRGDSRGWK